MGKKKAAPAKSEVNKSQAVRDYLKAHRGAKPKAVSDALKAEGIEVSPQTVSSVKFHMRKKKGRKRADGDGQRGGNSEMVSINALIDAKKLVDKIGGIEKAKSAVQALSKLA